MFPKSVFTFVLLTVVAPASVHALYQAKILYTGLGVGSYDTIRSNKIPGEGAFDTVHPELRLIAPFMLFSKAIMIAPNFTYGIRGTSYALMAVNLGTGLSFFNDLRIDISGGFGLEHISTLRGDLWLYAITPLLGVSFSKFRSEIGAFTTQLSHPGRRSTSFMLTVTYGLL